MTNTCKKSLVLTLLLTLLFLSNGCDRSSPTEVQRTDEYALSFVELGTVHMSRINLGYTTDSSYLADKAFEIGIYDMTSVIETLSMKNGDIYQKDLKPGTYKVKVQNPANYSFLYLPGEEFELEDGIGQIYAMVVNSKNSTKPSQPVAWEVYYSEVGSPAGEKPLAGGEVPALNPGELFTIHYNPEENPNRKAGNYMFKLINPSNAGGKKECWSGSIFCMGPIKPTEVTVSLIYDPGKLVVSKHTTGYVPAGAIFQFVISQVGNDNREMIRNSIKAGGSFIASLPPGTYQVVESKTGGALSYSKSIRGNITVSSGHTVYLTVTNHFPPPPKGTLNISKTVEGQAVDDASYEVSIKGAGGSINRSITAGQTISVDLTPGTYEVNEINTEGTLQVRYMPEGKITIKSNQTSNVKITNIYPNEIPAQ